MSVTPSAFTLVIWYPPGAPFKQWMQAAGNAVAAVFPATEAPRSTGPAERVFSHGVGDDDDCAYARHDDGWAALSLCVLSKNRNDSQIENRLRLLAELAKSEALRTQIHIAEIRREGGDAECFPLVPILRRRHLCVCAADAPSRRYADPDAFLALPGLDIERIGDQLLVTRGLDAITDEDFLKLAIPQARSLARVVRPGNTTYGGLPTNAELPLYQVGESRLTPVGYTHDSGLAEYAFNGGDKDQIPGWEVDGLYHLLQDGAFEDGRPIAGITVSFPNETIARAEATPLVDVGARVVFMRDGSEHELTDDP